MDINSPVASGQSLALANCSRLIVLYLNSCGSDNIIKPLPSASSQSFPFLCLFRTCASMSREAGSFPRYSIMCPGILEEKTGINKRNSLFNEKHKNKVVRMHGIKMIRLEGNTSGFIHYKILEFIHLGPQQVVAFIFNTDAQYRLTVGKQEFMFQVSLER